MTQVPIPKLYLGTMTFGWSQTSSKVTEPIALDMMNRFIDFHNESTNPSSQTIYVDTARIYAGGKTERILGTIFSKLKSKSIKISVGTKAHPSQPDGLSKVGIERQFQTSLKSMNLTQVDEFYLHQPDTKHNLLESLQMAHELVQSNLIQKIGMSNYHVSEVKRAFELCDEYQLTKPTVYQGLYNPLNRLVEEELVPFLKEHGCSFVAYNPLAAGLLTGKHNRKDLEGTVQKGRFLNNSNYMPRFFTPGNFDGLELIQDACKNEGISIVEATFRWLLRHSCLSEIDGIVLGASSMEHLQENLNGCACAASSMGPLPESVLSAFEDAWKTVKTSGEVFPYWRSYSADMPNWENLDHGASYSANK